MRRVMMLVLASVFAATLGVDGAATDRSESV